MYYPIGPILVQATIAGDLFKVTQLKIEGEPYLG